MKAIWNPRHNPLRGPNQGRGSERSVTALRSSFISRMIFYFFDQAAISGSPRARKRRRILDSDDDT
ncbi:hypothetical protein M407DRAFT_244289 [Tulasnella calospora MUT 4182]|uniref:Uncharacterized protein n=1 Tax=Tulasnella calospora MUT 4182 TaxID=1051891 RepID=A0A0C3QFG4_9AGAM|nr:hypothetical protein M407DRAFT_244289 [Tulasnella calospora MUT 4182]